MTTMYSLVDLAGIKFEESADTANDSGSVSSWIQAMTLGKYRHPEYGKITFTPERLARFADSINKRVTGIQPDIDYDHKAKTDVAAGWVQQAEVRDNGLWILVEWTKKAYQAIKDKEYKYFSPEFVDSWVHPKSGAKFIDVMRGGALTNRPFLKDIAQLQLSEIDEQEQEQFMDKNTIKKLAEELGLENPDEVTEEQVVAALVKEHEDSDKKESDEDNSDEDKSDEGSADEVKTELSDKDKSKLMSDPVTAKLVGILEQTSVKLAEQEKKFKDIDVESKVAKLSETATSKNVLLPAKIKDAAKKLFSEVDTSVSDKVLHLLSEMIKTGVAPVGEAFSGGSGGDIDTSDPVKKFNDAVAAKMASDKMTFSDAALSVAAENRDLYDAYRVGTYVE